MRGTWLLVLVLAATVSHAQIGKWQIGGSGLAWDQGDSLQVLVDFDNAPGSIQPRYLQPDQNLLPLLENWQLWRVPGVRNLSYVDGYMPRVWKRWNGRGGDPTQSGVFLIDADSTTYNAPRSEGIKDLFYTFDTAVPIPALQFGFFTPSQGFRSDGTPLNTDATPAFDISIGDEAEPAIVGPASKFGGEDFCINNVGIWLPDNCPESWQSAGYEPFQQMIANVAENLDPTVHVDFPRQYVRYFRWRRQFSVVDEDAVSTCQDCGSEGVQAQALKGSIGGFEIFAQGVPQRAVYLSQTIDLGEAVNFGRLHWSATALRLENGVAVEAPDAVVWLRAEVRVGRDGNPVTYNEFTDLGREREVPRAAYEALTPLFNREPQPGLRASVGYDSENWSFWSVPFTKSGGNLRLRSGSHLQLNLALESRDFNAWIRLDSLWIETAPLLADEVYAEVAKLDDLQPTRGITEVELGQQTEFVYEVRAEFDDGTTPGFDALRIHTGSKAIFRSLAMGSPPATVDPAQVIEGEDSLILHLSEKISHTNNAPIRVVFASEVFELAATFAGDIFNASSESLPQPIAPGDASEAISTSSLQVLAAASKSPDFIQSLTLSTPVLTPNGDGIHDQLDISYSLFRLTAPAPVALEVYALDGRRVAYIEQGMQRSGSHQLGWDGRDQTGQLLSPGFYLLSVSLLTEIAQTKQLLTLGIAY